MIMWETKVITFLTGCILGLILLDKIVNERK